MKRKLHQKKDKAKAHSLFPIDSTIISLTSKLLWSQGHHQVQLFCEFSIVGHHIWEE